MTHSSRAVCERVRASDSVRERERESVCVCVNEEERECERAVGREGVGVQRSVFRLEIESRGRSTTTGILHPSVCMGRFAAIIVLSRGPS